MKNPYNKGAIKRPCTDIFLQNVFLCTDIHIMSLDLHMTVLRKIYIYIQYLQYLFYGKFPVIVRTGIYRLLQ